MFNKAQISICAQNPRIRHILQKKGKAFSYLQISLEVNHGKGTTNSCHTLWQVIFRTDRIIGYHINYLLNILIYSSSLDISFEILCCIYYITRKVLQKVLRIGLFQCWSLQYSSKLQEALEASFQPPMEIISPVCHFSHMAVSLGWQSNKRKWISWMFLYTGSELERALRSGATQRGCTKPSSNRVTILYRVAKLYGNWTKHRVPGESLHWDLTIPI